ncbi:hypothetical protein MTQ01_12475 [Streptomyces sp. XM4193]|uniref:hypothetical protein n=1 Tax=Streptomyces sp. XM4193 TaxID=2929782 RepID=UPI001FF95901|nr:hypothetical protein [Streptomyces sp. XM4193]MCK1796815.1 hypothetical protein [Streptomyces sp. XM4193]
MADQFKDKAKEAAERAKDAMQQGQGEEKHSEQSQRSEQSERSPHSERSGRPERSERSGRHEQDRGTREGGTREGAAQDGFARDADRQRGTQEYDTGTRRASEGGMSREARPGDSRDTMRERPRGDDPGRAPQHDRDTTERTGMREERTGMREEDAGSGDRTVGPRQTDRVHYVDRSQPREEKGQGYQQDSLDDVGDDWDKR